MTLYKPSTPGILVHLTIPNIHVIYVLRLHGLVSARQSDKQTLASLEKRLQEERRCRLLVETQLANERRARANDVIEASKAQQRQVLCCTIFFFNLYLLDARVFRRVIAVESYKVNPRS